MIIKQLFIIYFVAILLAACAPVTPAPLPTQTPTLQPTLTATARPIENTPIATRRPFPTVTPTFIPTLTPSTPLAKSTYTLKPASAAQADEIINNIASQLNPDIYGRNDNNEKYIYLAFAEQEALLRFKDAPQAAHWRWDASYNLAMADASVADEKTPALKTYAALMEEALNNGTTNPDDLPDWFTKHESRLNAKVVFQTPPLGFQKTFLVNLSDAAFFWVTQKDGKFSVVGLRSSLFYYREAGIDYKFLDLTGDGVAELLLKFSQGSCCGTFSYDMVYDIAHGTPSQLQIQTTDGMIESLSSDFYSNNLTVLNADEKRPGFVLKSDYSDPITMPCRVKQYDKYNWDGAQFELVETWYGIDPSVNEICDFAISLASDKPEMEVAIKVIDDINYQLGGPSYPDEFRDGIRYRLGEYYARIGDVTKAQKAFTDLLAQPAGPAKPVSKWIDAAQIFLKNYHAGTDYYKTCAKIDVCASDAALETLIHNSSPEQWLQMKVYLTDAGVSVKSSGFFDFDQNNQMDQWLVVNVPGYASNQLWLVTQTNNGPQGLFVIEIPGTNPNMRHFDDYNLGLVTEIDAKTVFSLAWLKLADKPYIEKLTPSQKNEDEPSDEETFLIQALERIQTGLLLGENPEEIRAQLLAMQQTPAFKCGPLECDKFYYLLGLSNELAGDQQNAVNNYLQLWKDYPDSFFTIMARIKLVH